MVDITNLFTQGVERGLLIGISAFFIPWGIKQLIYMFKGLIN